MEPIAGRAIADAAMKFVTFEGGKSFGYAFIPQIERGTPTDFFWRVDRADLDKWGIKSEDLMDCVEQLGDMGHIEDIRYRLGIRPRGGFLNAGVVLRSRKNPQIACNAVFMDREFIDFPLEKPDVHLYFVYDIHHETTKSPADTAFEKLAFGAVTGPGIVGGIG
jgi:hypothetical protein